MIGKLLLFAESLQNNKPTRETFVSDIGWIQRLSTLGQTL